MWPGCASNFILPAGSINSTVEPIESYRMKTHRSQVEAAELNYFWILNHLCLFYSSALCFFSRSFYWQQWRTEFQEMTRPLNVKDWSINREECAKDQKGDWEGSCLVGVPSAVAAVAWAWWVAIMEALDAKSPWNCGPRDWSKFGLCFVLDWGKCVKPEWMAH